MYQTCLAEGRGWVVLREVHPGVVVASRRLGGLGAGVGILVLW
jgi:hypothetical protein